MLMNINKNFGSHLTIHRHQLNNKNVYLENLCKSFVLGIKWNNNKIERFGRTRDIKREKKTSRR